MPAGHRLQWKTVHQRVFEQLIRLVENIHVFPGTTVIRTNAKTDRQNRGPSATNISYALRAIGRKRHALLGNATNLDVANWALVTTDTAAIVATEKPR
jgi:hypothetical protein